MGRVMVWGGVEAVGVPCPAAWGWFRSAADLHETAARLGGVVIDETALCPWLPGVCPWGAS